MMEVGGSFSSLRPFGPSRDTATRRAGDIDFVESSIENARAQVTNVEKVTRTLESLHNEMHDFEDRIFFLEHVQLCKMALRGAEINSVER